MPAATTRFRKKHHGRNIFPLILITLVILVLFPFPIAGAPAGPLQINSLMPAPLHGAEGDKSRALPPRQNHMGPEIYPLTVPNHPLLAGYIEKYREPRHLYWIEAAYRRGLLYRDHIIGRLEHYGAPFELFFLPVVESEYNPHLVSRSGAAGIWQFMLNSIYPEMYINEWMDDRRDFWKATDAAIRKLLFNYSRLEDWLLALAAYNCGLSKMEEIIRTSGIGNFWQLLDRGLLPAETAHYVPRFLAVASILSYPGRNGIKPEWRENIEWEQVPVKESVDIRILSAQAEVPYELIKIGNTELTYHITPPNFSTYYLKVPAKYSDQIKRTLRDDDLRLLRFHLYTIRRGDTLYALSSHYGVSVEMILRYNPGIRPKSLQIGRTVVIPALRDVAPYEGPVRGASKTPEREVGPFEDIYRVKRGDTLWGISRKYGISPKRLAMENGISVDTVIHEGQELKVPLPKSERLENL